MLLDQVLIIFLSILIFFILLLIFNSIFKKNICPICGSVFLTWFLFIILFYSDYFENSLILALLIGASIGGIFNLLKEKLNIFKLPFILTLLTGAYFLLLKQVDFYLFIFNLVLWILFGLVFLYSKNQKLSLVIQKILKCCKNW